MAVENEQYKNKESFYHLEICCRLVSEKYGNPIIGKWTNSDYIRLSGILSRQTEVQISPSTLKRIFGKLKTSQRYYPQRATRNALADFAGFTDWEIFIKKHPKPESIEESPAKQADEIIIKPGIGQKTIHKKNRRVTIGWLSFFIIGVTIVAALIFRESITKKNTTSVHTDGTRFISSNAVGENPHSANFRIELPKSFSGDTANFTVDFGDGKKERRVSSGSVFTHYYEIPGRYYAVLKYESRPLDTIPIYLRTDGWTATAAMEHDTTRVYPINSGSFLKNGDISVEAKELLHAGVDTNRTFFVHFANVQPLNISGDNFELTANVTTSQLRPGVRCSQVNVETFGERSEHKAILIKPGCVSWAHLRFSETFRDGETEDLGSIGTDLSQGGIIKLRVVNKKVYLFVNEIQLYETAYQFPLKKIYGVKITFSGIGKLHDLIIKDLKTGEIFQDGFLHK